MAGVTSSAASSLVTRNQNVTLGSIFRRHAHRWLQRNKVPPRYLKVLQAIATCRTAAQGGRRQWCACGYERFIFFSCRNRHCPQCQTRAKEAWRAARQQELLPVPYFHHVFTLPHELNRLIWWSEPNQRLLFKALFDAAAETLLLFGRNELGGQVGFMMLLHTWDQQLRQHPHVHCLIPSGALGKDVQGKPRWIAGGTRFLFSVRALSKVYRGKYLDELDALWSKLDLPPELRSLTTSQKRTWLKKLRKHSWVVYAKPPCAGPAKLLDYLSRYTHRVAISNERIVGCSEETVKFRYRDRRDGNRQKTRILPVDEFLGRFMGHVLPNGFVRIRHYGFLATRNRAKSLKLIRKLLGATDYVPHNPPDLGQWLQEMLGIDPSRCPCCGDRLRETDFMGTYVPLQQTHLLTVNLIARGPP